MHNPFAQYRITDRWRRGHEAVDYGMDEGTPFGAPAAGIYRHDGTWDDAGIRGSLLLPDGGELRFAHLERHLAPHGARVDEGQLLAESGNTGKSSGPHMHTYGVTPHGARWNWTDQASPAWAASAPHPIIPTASPQHSPQEDDMALFLLTAENVEGAGFARGIRRYLVNPWDENGQKAKREISSEEEELYITAGYPRIPGLQTKSRADIIPTRG